MAEEQMPMLNWREKCVMEAFEEQAVLRYCDLPTWVGAKTMRGLIEKGLVELVDKNVGEYAKDRCWRRTKNRL
jgi:hypothetical protein